jgi:ribosomal protein S27AE
MDREPQLIVTTEPNPWDPDRICDRCGRRGTVARSHRTDVAESPMRWYCGACWPEQRAEQVRQSLDEGALYATAKHDRTITWERLVALVAAAERVLPREEPGDPRQRIRWRIGCVSIASELSAEAGRLEGPMPDVVREFMDRRRSF